MPYMHGITIMFLIHKINSCHEVKHAEVKKWKSVCVCVCVVGGGNYKQLLTLRQRITANVTKILEMGQITGGLVYHA